MVGVREFPSVPLVGQPFTLKGWCLTLQVLCQCGEPMLMVGQSGMDITCVCGRSLSFQGICESNGQVGFVLIPHGAPTGLTS